MDGMRRDAVAQIHVLLIDQQGTPVDPDPGFEDVVTVTIADSGGTQLLTGPASNGPGVGTYSRTLTVAQTQVLDVYTARWEATIGSELQAFTTTFEIVGGFIVSVAEIRAFDEVLTEAAYPTEDVIAAREHAEEMIEELCGVSFRPRGAREVHDGNGSEVLLLEQLRPRVIVDVQLDAGSGFVALTPTELADIATYPDGRIRRQKLGTFPKGRRNIKVLYEHGYTEAPEPVRRAVLELVRERLVPSPVPARATSLDTEGGTYRLSTAGREGPTGIPFVDSVVREFGNPRPPVG